VNMERLHKLLARGGIASRRKCEQLIAEGRVIVNGRIVTRPGTSVDPRTDQVVVDGRTVKPEKPIHIIINKPKGYVCASGDPQNRPLVLDLVRHISQRIYTVGRLDYDAEGLLILTNDGDFANRIIHPRQKIPKVYLARVKGELGADKLKLLRSTIVIDGKKTAPAQVDLLSSRGNRHELAVTIFEGRNRQIKRMFERARCWLLGLKRISIGPLELGSLKPGQYRKLSPREVALFEQ